MKAIAIDTETTGTRLHHQSRPFALSLLDNNGANWFWEWPVNYYTRQPSYPNDFMGELMSVLDGYDEWVFHNAKFDIRAITKAFGDFPESANLWERTHDTMIMSHQLDSSDPRGLKPLAIKYLRILDDDEKALRQEVIKARRTAKALGWTRGDHVEEDYWLPKAVNENSTVLADYCINDTLRTMGLYKLFSRILETEELQVYYERERRLLPIVYGIEERGITLRPKSVARVKKQTQKVADAAEYSIREVGKAFGNPDINVRSTVQLSRLLFTDIGVPCRHYTPKGKPRLDKEVLNFLSDDVEHLGSNVRGLAQLILQHRQATKALGDIEQYLFYSREEGDRHVLHTSLNQVGAGTTRFASKEPNSQNVSVRSAIPLRGLFGPSKGFIWYCPDYNQLELRILAVAANESNMLQAFREGKDIHQWTADMCGVERSSAKNANFAAVYGAGQRRLTEMTGHPEMGDLFYRAYPEIKRFTRRTISKARRTGYVETLSGYRLYVPPDRPYAAVDYVIQGTAGDILKDAMISIGDFAKKHPSKQLQMIMTIHDELVIELPVEKDTPSLRKAVVNCMAKEGKKYGVVTPVDLSIVRVDWSKPKEVTV